MSVFPYVCLYVPKYLDEYRKYSVKTKTKTKYIFRLEPSGFFIYHRRSFN